MSENEQTLLAGVKDFGSIEQEGFLWLLSVTLKFCLTAHLQDNSDFCGAWRRSSSNDTVAVLLVATSVDVESLAGSPSMDESPETILGSTIEFMTQYTLKHLPYMWTRGVKS